MFVDGIREELKKKRFSERQYFFGVGPVLGGWVGARQTNIFLGQSKKDEEDFIVVNSSKKVARKKVARQHQPLRF